MAKKKIKVKAFRLKYLNLKKKRRSTCIRNLTCPKLNVNAERISKKFTQNGMLFGNTVKPLDAWDLSRFTRRIESVSLIR